MLSEPDIAAAPYHCFPELTLGQELGEGGYLVMKSAHPLMAQGEPWLACSCRSSYPRCILYYKASSTKIFFFTFKSMCYRFSGSIYLFFKLAEREN